MNSTQPHNIKLVGLIRRKTTKLVWHFLIFLQFPRNFWSSLKKIWKGVYLFAERTLERLQSDCNHCNQVLGSRKKKTGEGVGRIPAALVASGEGEGAREKEWAMANLLRCLKGWIMGWRRLAGDGAACGGEGERRRGGSSRGMEGLRGCLASRDQRRS